MAHVLVTRRSTLKRFVVLKSMIIMDADAISATRKKLKKSVVISIIGRGKEVPYSFFLFKEPLMRFWFHIIAY